MSENKYLYIFNYDTIDESLCKLESRQLFNEEEKNKLLFSNIEIDPSHSAFIKKRLDVWIFSNNYSSLISKIKQLNIHQEGFKVEYVLLSGDKTNYKDRLSKLKDIGYNINGFPDYYHPSITYGLCFHCGRWYFGELRKNTFAWHKHKTKPCSYSNSISIHIAKALVNIAAQSNKDCELLDACCGVGTIMLEACFAKKSIEGCDINEKISEHARKNLSFFNYEADVHHSDIKNLSKHYHAAIIDLPYNLMSEADDASTLHIIQSVARISRRIIIVSITDIEKLITKSNLAITDYCSVQKGRKASFQRRIWVCESKINTPQS